MTWLQALIYWAFSWILGLIILMLILYLKSNKKRFLNKKKIVIAVGTLTIIIVGFFVFEVIYYTTTPGPGYVNVSLIVESVATGKPLENAIVYISYGDKESPTRVGATNKFGVLEETIPVMDQKDIYFLFAWGPLDGSTILSYEEIHPPWTQFDKWLSRKAPREIEIFVTWRIQF